MRPHDATWPSDLWIVRHGESAGNVARRHAMEHGHERIELSTRDMDVPISPLGERQAEALGRWFAENAEPVDVILSSPYVRACRTAAIVAKSAGWNAPSFPTNDCVKKSSASSTRLPAPALSPN